MAEKTVHLNGHVVLAVQASVSVSDAGLLHGASTFTTMLARHGKVFRLGRHLQRLGQAVRELGLHCQADPDVLASAVDELLAANELTDARVRITLTPGSVHGGESTTLITAEPLPAYPAEWYERGLTVAITERKQVPGDPTVGRKTGCYFPRILALEAAAAAGAQEALWFTPGNHLAEACFCNVFLIRDGQVATPPTATPVLPGVVREAVIEICGELGIACDADTPLTIHDLLAAAEVFLTSSCAQIRPVARVERHAVGEEKPGPLTRRILAAWQELLDKECPSS